MIILHSLLIAISLLAMLGSCSNLKQSSQEDSPKEYEIIFNGEATNPFNWICKEITTQFKCLERATLKNEVPVVDLKNNLLWDQREVIHMSWDSAQQYCKNLSLLGFKDWRLPNKEELTSMFAYNTGEGLYTQLELSKKFPKIHSSGYWSSTTKIQGMKPNDKSNAWRLSLRLGYLDNNNKNNNNYVRCVRSKK